MKVSSTVLIAALMADAPKLSRYDASARGDVTVCQFCAQLTVADFSTAADSGSSTIKLR